MRTRHAAYALAAFLAAWSLFALVDPTKATGNGDPCATVRNGTPTTCPEPFPPMTPAPSTSTTSEPAATTTSTLPQRPPVIDTTPDPEPRDETVILPPLVVDADPAVAVQSEAEYTG